MKARDIRPVREAAIQGAIVELLKHARDPATIYFAVPNGEPRDKRTAAKLKWQGVIPGIADIALTLPDGRSAYIEVKAPAGRLSEAQEAFRDHCERYEVPWAVCRSVDEAEAVLRAWGALRQREAA